MQLLYRIGILFYRWFISLAAFTGNRKAQKWILGRQNWKHKLKKEIQSDLEYIWFHCASLGEYEQARPLIKSLIKKSLKPSQILLTFFSPSGFEVITSKNLGYTILYLPIDSPKNAKYFVQNIPLQYAIFVKYEVWANYFKQLKENDIPLYLISSTFRETHFYFKFYGKWFLKFLNIPKIIFVQNQKSFDIAKKHIQTEIILSGDTRFDTVLSNKNSASPNLVIENFKNQKLLLVAGSSWQAEEDMLCKYIKQDNSNNKYIIAPHDISEKHINQIKSQLEDNSFICYSEVLEEQDLSNYKTLIIDNIGILSNIYQYADIAFIGGGFSEGLHNILEPATFGVALTFGDNHHKNWEAQAMIDNNAAIAIKNFDSLNATLNYWFLNLEELTKTKNNASKFISDNAGATHIIEQKLRFNRI